MTQAVAASSDAPSFQLGEGGSQPTLPLHLPLDFSAPRYTIRPVSMETASAWFRRWHYLGDAPPVSVYWGFFAPDLLGVVSIGQPNNASGVERRLGLDDLAGNVEINRVARHPEADVSTSRLLALAVRTAARAAGWFWCYSYADPDQGHHGGIYQALGAVYVGVTPSQRWPVINGVPTHARTAVSIYGTRSPRRLAALGYSVDEVVHGGKHLYILPVPGPRAAEIRERLRSYSKPYPKRLST